MNPTRLASLVLLLAGAASAVLVTGGTALAATADPLSLSVSPGTVLAAPGVHHVRETITVTDSGTQPLHVTTSTTLLGHAAGACTEGASPSWASVSPGRIDLAPGQSATAVYTINAPAVGPGSTGTVDTAALFAAQLAGHGQVSIGGTVGSRVVLRLTGDSTTVPKCGRTATAPKAAPPRASGPASGSPAAGIAGAALVLGLGTWAWRRHRRNRRARQEVSS